MRPFRKTDLAPLLKLDRSCFAPGIAYSLSDLKYFLSNPRSFSLVAEDDREQIAGFIIVEHARFKEGMAGHIVTIDVEAGMRRKGVGKRLLETAATHLQEEGAARLILEVAVDNAGARSFYQRLGFAEVGRIPKYYSGGMDATVMEKNL